MDILGVLETAIGIVLVYLVLSLVCTAALEVLVGLTGYKPRILRQLITKLVGAELTQAIYQTDEIETLTGPKRQDPSYIPSDVFAKSLMQVVTGGEWARLSNTPTVLRDRLLNFGIAAGTVRSADAERVSRTLVDLLDEAGGDADLLLNKIELWFDRTGDRSKGWFKRGINRRLVLLGFVVAALVNADTIMIFQQLTTDPSVRAAAVQVAETKLLEEDAFKCVPDPADPDKCQNELTEQIRKQIGDIEPFIGWSSEDRVFTSLENGNGWLALWYWFLKLTGWLMTAFAVSLGAPFWFDLLQRLMNIRKSIAPAQPRAAGSKNAASAGKDDGDSTGGDAGAGSASGEVPTERGPMPGFLPTAATVRVGNAYWLARSADLAYETDAGKLARMIESWGMRARSFSVSQKATVKGVEIGVVDTQGFVAVDEQAVLVCFRGTEPSKPGDIVTDARFELTDAQDYADGACRVHTGFKQAIDAAWADVSALLSDSGVTTQSVWFAGHSLGGALAVLAASRYDLEVRAHNDGARKIIAGIDSKPEAERATDASAGQRQKAVDSLKGRVAGVYTIGQPRVGDKDFASEIDSRFGEGHVRVVNNRDVVPRVPLRAMDYEHSGKVLYLDEFGRLHRDPGLWYRLLDTVLITPKEMAKAKEGVADHSSKAYVDLLNKARGG